MSNSIQETYTVKEIQEILHIGTNTAYALIHSGVFPVKQIQHIYRIPKASFIDWLNSPGAGTFY